MFKGITGDWLYALRLLVRHPKFTISAVFCLALGIAPNIMLFSLVNEALLQPPKVPRQETLISLSTYTDEDGERDDSPFTYPDYLAVRETAGLEGMAVLSFASAILGSRNRGYEVTSMMVSDNYFEVVGEEAYLGTYFREPGVLVPGQNAAIVLNYAFWRDTFGGDPDIIGSTLRINSYDYTVVAVTPPYFEGFIKVYSPDVFIPLSMGPLFYGEGSDRLTAHDHRWLVAVGRIEEDTDLAALNSNLEQTALNLEQQYPDSHLRRRFRAGDYLNIPGAPGETLRNMVIAIMSLFILVMITVCLIVASMYIAFTTERRKEMAVRIAMGARRGRIFRQVLSEAVLQAFVALVPAFLVSILLLDFVGDLYPRFQFLKTAVRQPGGLLYALIITLLAGLLFGLIPAIHAGRQNVFTVLKDQAGLGSAPPSVSLIRKLLTIGQFAFAVILLVVAGSVISTLRRGGSAELGIDAEHLARFRFEPLKHGYTPEEARKIGRELAEALGRQAGVVDVSLSRLSSFEVNHRTRTYLAPISEDLEVGARLIAAYNYVAPNFFETVGLPILEGRAFKEGDHDRAGYRCIISRYTADQLWPGQNALGKTVSVHGGDLTAEVVGIVDNAKYNSPLEDPTVFVYLPLDPILDHELTLSIRTSIDPQAVLPELRKKLVEFDRTLIPDNLTTVKEDLGSALVTVRILAGVLVSLGIFAWIPAMIGLLGAVSYQMRLKQREIGIRAALGAHPKTLVRLLMRRGLVWIFWGTLIGIPIGILALSPLASSLSMPIEADWLSIGVLLPAVFVVVLFAVWIPARRFAKVNPMKVLRYE